MRPAGGLATGTGHDQGTRGRLAAAGRIPYTKTGKHRRLRIQDVLACKEQRDGERKAQLDELTNMSEELGGYGELK